MEITCEDITTEVHAEQLRRLRNECAEWMTGNTSQITPAQQSEFFRARIATGQAEGFIMYVGGESVAYGVLFWDEQGRAWSSTGVKASARGQGLGRAVTVENARRAHAKGVPIWAEVRADNAGQQKICRTVGYQPVDTLVRDGVAIDVMRCDELAEAYA